MAIVQTLSAFQAMAAKVGVPKERAAQIHAATPVPTTVAGLRSNVKKFGYYDQKADHLVSAGVTFA